MLNSMETGDRRAKLAAGIGVAATAAIAALLLRSDRPGRFDQVAFAAVLAVPSALAVASLARRTVLFAPAALLAVGLSPVLWSGILLLLVPGIAYATVYLRSPRPTMTPRLRSVAAVLAPTGITIVAFWMLTSETTERCATTVTATGSSTACASVTTPTHAAIAVTVACIAVIVGWVVAQPARHSVRSHG
jgi:hypothetical protein